LEETSEGERRKRREKRKRREEVRSSVDNPVKLIGVRAKADGRLAVRRIVMIAWLN
jgi:hypothetical protein